MSTPPELPQTPEMQRMMAMQRQQVQEQAIRQRYLHDAQKIAYSKNILQRLKPEAAGRFIKNVIQQRKASRSDSQPSSPENSMSGSSSSTLIAKHPGPSDDSSSTSTAKVHDGLKRKRSHDEDELDEVAERVKRLKVHRNSLWESFDDSQFKMNSGLLYDDKLWDWYW